MDRTSEQWTVREGTDVISADDQKVGKVVAVQPTYLVVEKGFFFPTDYYIPTSAVANYDGDKAYLSVTKDEALNQGWDSMPQEDASYTTTSTTYDTAGTAGSYTADMGATGDQYAATQRTTTELEGDTLRVPVHEEELTAVTREREAGRVRIGKDVVEEERQLEVPVTEERVRVERRAVDRDAAPADAAFEEGTIEVPLRAEEVELQKRTRVAEEIEIGKEAVQRTEQVAGTVRREEVRVAEDVTDADATTR